MELSCNELNTLLRYGSPNQAVRAALPLLVMTLIMLGFGSFCVTDKSMRGAAALVLTLYFAIPVSGRAFFLSGDNLSTNFYL